MNAAFSGVFLPDAEVLLDVDLFHAVERHNVKFAHGFIVLGRISGRHDHPSCRELLIAERFALQKLEHHRRQRLRDAVDLVEEQDALGNARALDLAVDRCDDLAHRVARHRALLAAEPHLFDKRQSERGLARVVSQRIGNQSHAGLLRDLLHDLGLADARRADEQHRPLPDGRNAPRAELVLRQISAQRVLDLLFCSFDIHEKHLGLVSVYSLLYHASPGRTSAALPLSGARAIIYTRKRQRSGSHALHRRRKRTYPHLRDAGGGGVHPAVRDTRPGRAAARRDRRRARHRARQVCPKRPRPRPLRPGHVFRARDLRRPAPRARSGQHPRGDAAEARQNRRQLCVLQLPLARGADYDGQRFRV